MKKLHEYSVEEIKKHCAGMFLRDSTRVNGNLTIENREHPEPNAIPTNNFYRWINNKKLCNFVDKDDLQALEYKLWEKTSPKRTRLGLIKMEYDAKRKL